MLNVHWVFITAPCVVAVGLLFLQEVYLHFILNMGSVLLQDSITNWSVNHSNRKLDG